MDLTPRQKTIIELVRKNKVMTGDKIANALNLTRASLRGDFTLLVTLEYLNSSTNKGYTIGEGPYQVAPLVYKVEDVMSIAKNIDINSSLGDVLVKLFLEDVDSVQILKDGYLMGLVSKTNLVKAMINYQDAKHEPITKHMIGLSKLITCSKDEELLLVLRRMIESNVDSIPVVTKTNEGHVLEGVVTKTSMLKLLHKNYCE